MAAASTRLLQLAIFGTLLLVCAGGRSGRAAEAGLEEWESRLLTLEATGDLRKATTVAEKAVRRLASAQPANPLTFEAALEHLLRLYRAAGRLPDGDRLLASLAPSHPVIEAAVQQARLETARAAGDRETVERLLDRLDVIRTWRLLGPFRHPPGSDLETALPPEKQSFEADATFDGFSGTVGWRSVRAPRGSGWIDLGAFLRPTDEVVAYLRTVVQREHAGSAGLALDTNQPVRLWVNGRLQATEPGLHAVPLEKGSNTIRLKLAREKKVAGWTVRIRLLNPAGGGNERGSDDESETWEAAFGPALYRPLIGSKQMTATDWFHLGLLLESRGGTVAGIDAPEAYDRARRAVPENAHFQFAFGRSALHAPRRSSLERDDNPARKALRTVLRRVPGHLGARLELARFYLDRLRMSERAERLLAEGLRLRPGHVPLGLLSVRLLRERGLSALADSQLRTLAEAAETRPPALLLALAEDRMRHHRFDDAEAVLEAAFTCHATRTDIRRRRLALARTRGDLKAQQEVVDQGLAWNEQDLGLQLERAHLLRLQGTIEAAIQTLRRATEQIPEEPSSFVRLGHLLHRLGRDAEAFRAWDRALAIDPAQPDLRRYVNFLREDRQAYYEPYRLPTEALRKASRKLPIDPDVPARILWRQHVIRLHPDGRVSEFVQEGIRIENETGQKAFRSYDVRFAIGEQRVRFDRLRVVRRDGSVTDGNVGRPTPLGVRPEFTTFARQSADLPRTRVGDVIEVAFERTDLKPGFFGGYFGRLVPLGGPRPVEVARVIVLHPEGRTVHHRLQHLPESVGPSRRTVDGRVELRFQATHLEALEYEPGSPPLTESLPAVQLSTFRDWADFGRWYRQLIRDQYRTSDALEKKARELTRGLERPEEKVAAIYRFVSRDVRYNDEWEFGIHGYKPFPAATIFARRFGDCKDKSLLLQTMLGTIGIEAHPVLIDARARRGRRSPELPLVGHFNHCIAFLPDQDGLNARFVDPTARYHPVDSLPAMDRGARVVIIGRESGRLATTPSLSVAENFVEEKRTLRLADDGSARIRTVVEPVGEMEARLRGHFGRRPYAPEALEQLVGPIHPSGVTEILELPKPGDRTNAFRLRFDVRLPAAGRRAKGGALELRLHPPLLHGFAVARRLADLVPPGTNRKTDLLLGNPSGYRVQVACHLPENRVWRGPTDPVHLETEFGTFRFEMQAEDGSPVHVKARLEIHATRIPRDRVADFRSFCQRVDETWQRLYRIETAD